MIPERVHQVADKIAETVRQKKNFYNKVNRTCDKYDLEKVYEGSQHAYISVKILKDNWVLSQQSCDDEGKKFPLDIDWKKIHEDLNHQGYIGGNK